MLQQLEGLGIDEIHRRFSWSVPPRYNLGAACSDHQRAADVALLHARGDGTVDRYAYGDLSRLSNSLANALRADGVGRGDRVAVILPQSPLTVVAHLAAYKLGALAVPLSSLFGPDALEVRLRDSAAKLAITDGAALEKLEKCLDALPDLTRLILADGDSNRIRSRTFHDAVAAGSEAFTPVDTSSDDPALLIYTSGTTGGPKGAVHAHRVLLGHLPGFELSHAFFPKPGDLFWTPADFAWIGGLMDALFPALVLGRTILIADAPSPFDPEWALNLMARHRVRNTFLPPTALKMMRRAGAAVPPELSLRTAMSGGESLGVEMLEWAEAKLHVTVNEIFGQTECNYVVGNCATLYPVRSGSMGRAYPGHHVAVVDADGVPQPPGIVGEVAIRRPDPVMFLGYWDNPAETRRKYRGDWLVTGDFAESDPDGYLTYVGRGDDLISSAGYRIGPVEIEECLMRHPAVALAAVVGVPDAVRGEVVKAYVVPREGVEIGVPLERDIQEFVKSRLAAYQYPRLVDFVPELPLTTTGKIRRSALRQRHLEASRRPVVVPSGQE